MSKLDDNFQPLLVYRGEYVARRIYNSLEDGSRIWVLWEDDTCMECCRLCKTASCLDIAEVYRFPNFLVTNNAICQILREPSNVAWLNLCHFRAKDGSIQYDRFYDGYPTGNDVQSELKTIALLREQMSNLISAFLPFKEGDILYVDGSLGMHNILQDLLIKGGLESVHRTGLEVIEEENTSIRCANTCHINLFSVQLDSTSYSSFPENTDVIVYVESHDKKSGCIREEIQIRRINHDFLGNSWMTIQRYNGSIDCCHYTKSNIKYTEVVE